MSGPKSIFFVKRCGVAVCSEQQACCPRRGPAHLLTHGIQRHAGICLDDQLVVDVHDDGAAPERAHGVAENIAGGGLHDVLHELRAIGIQPLPFLRRADAFIGDNKNIKFSVLIGSPDTCAVRAGEFFGIWEYVWEWPSERYPDNYRMEAPKELIQTEYYSRFVKGLWVVPDKTEEEVAIAAIAAGKARFEYGEKPTV